METIKKAIEFHKKGDFKSAEALYLEFLAINPDEGHAHHLLGALYLQNKEFVKAKKHLELAYSLEKEPPIETDLAMCEFELEEYESALDHFKNISNISKTAENELILDKMAQCAKLLKLPEDYLEYLIKSLKYSPGDIVKLREIAGIAQDLEIFDTAEFYLKKVLEICPDDHIAMNNLGLLYEFVNDLKSAKTWYKKSVETYPLSNTAYNLYIVLRKQQRYKEAYDVLENIKGFKDFDQKYYNQAFGLLHLVQKKFKNGLAPYVDYLKVKQKENIKIWWDGKPNKNASLVICATEGYGDIFMFTRYLDFVNTENFKEVSLIVPENLYDLYKFNFPNFTVRIMGEDVFYNFATIMINLPNIYNIDFEHIPSSEKYLITPPDYTEKWRKYFNAGQNAAINAPSDMPVCGLSDTGTPKTPAKKRIGIFFAGNITKKRTLRNRKVDFEKIRPLLEIDGAEFYSLQPETTFREAFCGQNIVDLSDKIKNFSDTAAIIDELDLVISVDSAVAHLAGALGKKTFIMLPYYADWRWFDDTKSTPWYASAEIFKQTKEGIWDDVIEKIKERIEAL